MSTNYDIVVSSPFSNYDSFSHKMEELCSSALSRDVSPRLDAAMTRRFGIHYQHAATVLTGLLAAFAATYSSATVFDVVVFSLSVLAASVGAPMLVTVFRRRTSSRAMMLAMLSGVGVVLLWRYVGYDQTLSDVVPGILSALIVHEAVVRVSTRMPPASPG